MLSSAKLTIAVLVKDNTKIKVLDGEFMTMKEVAQSKSEIVRIRDDNEI